MKIKFRKIKYKYKLSEAYQHPVPVRASLCGIDQPSREILRYDSGRLVIGRGYEWDGPTGIPMTINALQRASLVHDALYQLIRKGVLPGSYRKDADKEFASICIDDGVPTIISLVIYVILRMFGGRYAKPDNIS